MDELSIYIKHTPRLLRQQLLNELVVQYLTDYHKASGVEEDGTDNGRSSPPLGPSGQQSSPKHAETRRTSSTQSPEQLLSETTCRPSIQRFHGALLFVDISGFTPLAQKLDVESLKNQINGYFTKILEIVDKWGGDVVKFAGDALYIVWPTDIHAMAMGLGNDRNKDGQQPAVVSVRSVAVGTSVAGNSRFAAAARQALEKAVACGLEISVSCGKYEVRLDDLSHGHDVRSSSSMLGRFLPNFSLSSFLNTSNAKISPTESISESVVYLDVHAGVSMGLMAGVDIGHLDRWEYFLVGEPVSRVAECEGDAEKGDVVICKKAHSLLHSRNDNNALSTRRKDDEQQEHVTIRSRRWGQTQQQPKTPNAMSARPVVGGGAGGGETKLACGCFVTQNGLYCVSKLDAAVPPSQAARGNLRKSRSRSKLEGDAVQGEINAQSARLNDELNADLEKVLRTTQGLFKQGFTASWNACQRNSSESGNAETCGGAQLDSTTVNSTSTAATAVSTPAALPSNESAELQFLEFFRKQLRVHFANWARAQLLDDIVRHVHEATRDEHEFAHTNRLGVFTELVRAVFTTTVQSPFNGSMRSDDSTERMSLTHTQTLTQAQMQQHFPAMAHMPQHGTSATSSAASLINSDAALESPVDAKLRLKPERHASLRFSLKHVSQEAQSTAELRTVTVMFIKIDAFDLKLLVDSFRTPKSKNSGKNRLNARCGESFSFLDRTDNEIAADLALLNRLQRCIEVLCNAFKEHDGQLRQFIVDDKGTVCIGTFGLRGAVSADNAAAAVLAARKIVSSMPALGLSASIGVTSGKTYCGLVGSVFRHEYAVMGPSTNLSARLMCKAPPNSVICDTEMKNRDRTHLFDALDVVQAKGYTEPVMTYRPVYDDFSEDPHRMSMSATHTHSHTNTHPNSLRRIDRSLARSRSDHSLASLLAPAEKIRRIAQSEFFVVNMNIQSRASGLSAYSDPAASANATSASSAAGGGGGAGGDPKTHNDLFMKLFGRANEIALIFEKLFSPAEEGQFHEVFEYTKPCQMIAICGSVGVGKTALVTAISRKLLSVARQDSAFNLSVIHKKQSAVHSNVPLHGWKAIVLELLRQINHTVVSSESGGARPRHRSSRIGVKMDVIAGLDIVLERLVEFKDLRQLLLHALGLTPDHQGETTSILSNILSNKEKLHRCMDFVVALVCMSADVFKKLVLIVLEGVELLDKWSLVILHKIWLDAEGVSLLVTYSPGYEASLRSWSVDVYENAPPIKPSACILYEFFKRYDEAERFRAVDLRPLGKTSILVLARDFFGVHIDDENDLDKLYTASGGHPLYVVELMKTLIQNAQDVSDFAKGRLMSVAPAQQQQQQQVQHHRIEEIICFRLDKLDFSLQIVLKAAAVAASHGRPFSKALIEFILIENDLFAGVTPPLSARSAAERDRELAALEDEDASSIPGLLFGGDDEEREGEARAASAVLAHIRVSEVLLMLLHKDEFLRMPSFAGTNKRDITLHMVESGAEMEFQIPLEQVTIYSIVIDDQKYFFHERIALFHHTQIAQEPQAYDTLDGRENEGFHWERAALWSRALRSYMSCALKERERESGAGWAHFLRLAYRMYKCMEQETAQLLPLEEWTDATIEFILKTFFGTAATTSKSVKSRKSAKSINNNNVMANACDPNQKRETNYALAALDENDDKENDKKNGKEKGSERESEDDDEEALRLLREDLLSVQEVFEIDAEVLPLVALLHVHLADLYLRQYEEMDIVLFVLGVAFKLFLFAMVGRDNVLRYYAMHGNGNGNGNSNANTMNHKTSLSRQHSFTENGSEKRRSRTSSLCGAATGGSTKASRSPAKPSPSLPTAQRPRQPFEIRDASFRQDALGERDALHLLSTFSVAYHFSAAASADFQEMIARITDRCVAWTARARPRGSAEYVQSLNLAALQQMNSGAWSDAVATCGALLTHYEPRVHAKALHEQFGGDITLYLLAKVAQRALLVGTWSLGESLAQRLLAWLESPADAAHVDPSTLLLALIPLLPTLVATKRVDDALRVWDSLGLRDLPASLSQLEVALKPVCAAIDPWLRLKHGELLDFAFSSYFESQSAIDGSAGIVATAAAAPALLLPAPIVDSMARALSTVFSDDALSTQLVKLLTFGGCALSSINAQIATFELRFDRTRNESAQWHFTSHFEQVIDLAMNDSPGSASAVNALNMSGMVNALAETLESDATIGVDTVLNGLRVFFCDDVLALVRVWHADKLVWPVRVLARFAVKHLDLALHQDVAAEYKQLWEESERIIAKDEASRLLL